MFSCTSSSLQIKKYIVSYPIEEGVIPFSKSSHFSTINSKVAIDIYHVFPSLAEIYENIGDIHIGLTVKHTYKT